MRNGHFLLYKRLYRDLTWSRRPAMAIQLYSAMHHTAILRYTVYMLYIMYAVYGLCIRAASVDRGGV